MNAVSAQLPTTRDYLIQHGNIASVIHVTINGVKYTAMYMNDTPKVQLFRDPGTTVDVWHELSIEIAAIIVRQFKLVFSRPLSERSAVIKTLTPVEITV